MPVIPGAEPYFHAGSSGTGVLLCHGFTGSPGSLRPWAQYLADAGLTKAETQISEEHYAQAIDTLGGVIARHPVNADAYTYLGYAYRKLGDDAKALENFRRAVQVDPQHLGANKYLADVYLSQGNLQRAMEQLQVIRMICSGLDCAELNALQSEINAFHKKKDGDDKDGNKGKGSDE